MGICVRVEGGTLETRGILRLAERATAAKDGGGAGRDAGADGAACGAD